MRRARANERERVCREDSGARGLLYLLRVGRATPHIPTRTQADTRRAFSTWNTLEAVAAAVARHTHIVEV